MEALVAGDPRSIGRYRLAARLGQGGMGQVFLGRSPGGRAVAVKVVRPELAADAEFRRRFAKEVEAARRVGGFHTSPVVDADPHGDPPWLVTAYIPGPSLASAVAAHGPLPERSLRVLAAGLAEALEAVHAAGVVHRDLKPSNILLADDGPRVIDFGIARALDATSGLTQTGQSPGTVGFMAPEQLTDGNAGPPVDVFAFGAVLCHACGVLPFGEGPTHALLYRVVHQEPALDDLPASLREVAAACLAKDPATRPTPTELLSRFAAAEQHEGAWLPEPVHAMATRLAVPVEGPGGDPREARTAVSLAAHSPSAAPPLPAPAAAHPTASPPQFEDGPAGSPGPPGTVFRRNTARLVVSLTANAVWALALAFVALLLALQFLKSGEPMGGLLGAVCLLASIHSLRDLIFPVIALTRPYLLHVGPAGIGVVFGGRTAHYDWRQISRVTVRRSASDWAVSIIADPAAPRPARSRLGRPYSEKSKHLPWTVLVRARELHSSRQDLASAVAYYAGPRWTSGG